MLYGFGLCGDGGDDLDRPWEVSVRTNMFRLGRGTFLLLLSLLALGDAQPISAQTSESIGRLTDEQYRQWIANADAVAVQEINRHDAYAVAARYWDDATDISPAGVASGRPAIERRFVEEFNRTELQDFVEIIDAAHVSGDSG
jgi:hypothetical protein